MSRSWTERFRPKARLGLRFARDAVFAAHVISRKDTEEVAWARHEPLPDGWSSNNADFELLTKTIRELCAPAHGQYVTVQVALPDPLFVSRIFALDTLPRSRKAQSELAAWRLKKEFDLSDDIEPASQALGREGTKELLLGVAGPRTWLEGFRQMLKGAGVTVRSIDMVMRYRFNAFHDAMIKKGPAALIALDTDTWSVCAFDDEGRTRFFSSRWRKPGASEISEAAEEIERIILGYVSSMPGRTVKRLFVTGVIGESEALCESLRARTNGQCDYLDFKGARFTRARGGIHADAGALAVAVAR